MHTTPHLGRNIRAIRLIQEIKQSIFAHQMGVSQQAVSQLEAQQHIADSKLEQVAEILQVSVTYIRSFEHAAFLLQQENAAMISMKNEIDSLQQQLNNYRQQEKG